MKTALTLMGIAFAVSLAIVVGTRLSHEAMAVAVGAICGIVASVPVVIGLVLASQRQSPKQPELQHPSRIIIIPNRRDEDALMVMRPYDD